MCVEYDGVRCDRGQVDGGFDFFDEFVFQVDIRVDLVVVFFVVSSFGVGVFFWFVNLDGGVFDECGGMVVDVVVVFFVFEVDGILRFFVQGIICGKVVLQVFD